MSSRVVAGDFVASLRNHQFAVRVWKAEGEEVIRLDSLFDELSRFVSLRCSLDAASASDGQVLSRSESAEENSMTATCWFELKKRCQSVVLVRLPDFSLRVDVHEVACSGVELDWSSVGAVESWEGVAKSGENEDDCLDQIHGLFFLFSRPSAGFLSA